MGIIGLALIGVVCYIAAGFTKTWLKQAVLGAVVGVLFAAVRFGGVQDMASILNIPSRTFPEYAVSVAIPTIVVALLAMLLQRRLA